ncbi:MAG TPA: hypothetical protein VD790_01590 [Thermoleophilaceae bacterium]|nr:hypothetical protein [Thermoleophilaceae bacterium]
MLTMFFVSLALCTVGIVAVAVAARHVMARLGLEPMDALLWLGLAERPVDAAPPRPGA